MMIMVMTLNFENVMYLTSTPHFDAQVLGKEKMKIMILSNHTMTDITSPKMMTMMMMKMRTSLIRAKRVVVKWTVPSSSIG